MTIAKGCLQKRRHGRWTACLCACIAIHHHVQAALKTRGTSYACVRTRAQD